MTMCDSGKFIFTFSVGEIWSRVPFDMTSAPKFAAPAGSVSYYLGEAYSVKVIERIRKPTSCLS
jgi:hypothetical protein